MDLIGCLVFEVIVSILGAVSEPENVFLLLEPKNEALLPASGPSNRSVFCRTSANPMRTARKKGARWAPFLQWVLRHMYKAMGELGESG
ncbi:MAG: hypothetical protein V8T00_05040 [Oscillospiraceae bacterium]